jgi:membrane protein
MPKPHQASPPTPLPLPLSLAILPPRTCPLATALLALLSLLLATALWLALGVLLTWVFRAVTPGRPRWWVALAGGLGTGSFLAGFLHGFQLFLSLPVDVGIPFGGLGYVGGVVAVGLWLYVLHVFLLVGWATTQALEERAARDAVTR